MRNPSFMALPPARRLRRGRAIHPPIEGVFMRFALLETLAHYSPEQLRTFADSVLHAQQYYEGEQGV
jgi:hypothetical protein